MKILIVEDEFTSRALLNALLTRFGKCEIAVNGNEAIQAFRSALNNNEPYDLVCLDIMMPGIDGQEVLKEMRRMEAEQNRKGLDGAKIIMTTALSDEKSVRQAFREQCDGYIVKPITHEKLYKMLKDLGVVQTY